MRNRIYFLAVVLAFYWPLQGQDSPQVILKLDDLKNESGLVHPGWQQVMDFLNEEGVTGAIGLIGNSLEKGDQEYINWIKSRHAEGHEIWHHGYCHCRPTVAGKEVREFRGTSYAYQLDNLQKTQQLAREKLGLTLLSFGAPYNNTDSSTIRALAELGDITTWMYKETSAPTEKHVFKRIHAVNIEYPVHIPRVDKLRAGFKENRTEPLLIIQGHPRSWVDSPKRFRRFKRIVRYLKKQGVRFTTPSAYYAHINK
ncbi:DUF2334 domain-containing protein [Neolewinella aurantiaca]|uniref:DUF2334 domain-containing protein n=1 Tax=Neolewinella aurantiaca TaxID=2602767 RepID=A0A5C7G1H9_9BACT|nr:DUF2334 domain-containing protein [Neolewinella aurantiaca]TXF91772.1 DUF2334 domain-containing protein [Neolewinella aurantiaca]